MENAKRNPSRRTSAASPVVPLAAGRRPPQAIDLEQAVLGALMIDGRSADRVVNIFQDNDQVFYQPEHRHIYSAIVHLYNDSQPIDLLTVSNQLRTEGHLDAVGGDYYLVQLTQRVTSAANIEFHARIIQQKYFQRELIHLSNNIIDQSYDDSTDVFDLLDEAEAGIFNITNTNIKKSYEKADDLVHQAIKRIEELSKQEGGISGLASGFRDIDKCTAGWQNSDLIVIAARPGMGKTAFVVSMAKNMAIRHQIPVAMFSLEMSSVQLITRMISSETGIPSNKLREGSLQQYEWDVLYQKVKDLERAPIYIDETPGLSLLEFRAKARRLVSQGVKILIIDYLQLMTVGGKNNPGNREQEISTISRTAQGRRQGAQRPGDRPFAAFTRCRGADRTKAAFAAALARIGSHRAGCGHRQLYLPPGVLQFRHVGGRDAYCRPSGIHHCQARQRRFAQYPSGVRRPTGAVLRPGSEHTFRRSRGRGIPFGGSRRSVCRAGQLRFQDQQRVRRRVRPPSLAQRCV